MFVFEQVFGRRLFGSADRSGTGLAGGRVGGKSCANNRIVLGLVGGQAVGGKAVCSSEVDATSALMVRNKQAIFSAQVWRYCS